MPPLYYHQRTSSLRSTHPHIVVPGHPKTTRPSCSLFPWTCGMWNGRELRKCFLCAMTCKQDSRSLVTCSQILWSEHFLVGSFAAFLTITSYKHLKNNHESHIIQIKKPLDRFFRDLKLYLLLFGITMYTFISIWHFYGWNTTTLPIKHAILGLYLIFSDFLNKHLLLQHFIVFRGPEFNKIFDFT